MVMEAKDFQYQSGFGNDFTTEAVEGALPNGRNSPQRAPLGLYAEQISGTAFTQPRAVSRRTWVYRILPSAAHPAFRPIPNGRLRATPFNDAEPDPNRLRWDPLPLPHDADGVDFVDGLYTVAGNGDLRTRNGMAAHIYAANRDMTQRYFVDSDGELLFVPELGPVVLHTELGSLHVAPGEIAIVPRGIRFRAELPDGRARGYLCENFGAPFTLPERGPIGSNGLAAERDFLAPHAAFEERPGPVQVVQKFGGNLWAADYDHSPLDVVAWRGNYAPVKYDSANFMTIGTVSFDHPDPSIYTVLTSPSELPGLANVDFVIFPPRWLVGEDTFRPPWYHRNIMAEFMGLVRGAYDAKAEGFLPGGASLHNTFASHGPDAATFDRATGADLRPEKLEGTLAFMFESRWMIMPTGQAMDAPHRQRDYDAVWDGLTRHFRGLRYLVFVAISHVSVGSGDHRVLALHGWFGSATGWGHLPEYLNGRDFSYVFADMRGYGERKGEAGDFTMAEAAADAVALADELGWERFSIVGHCMGGVAIQHVLLQAPGRIRRLVGITPVPASGAQFGGEAWRLFSGAAVSPPNRAAIVDFSTGARLTPVFINKIVGHSLENSTAEAFGGYLSSWARADIVEKVKGNPVPVKVIAGEQDPSLSPEVMEHTWLEHYPNAELEVIRGSGHYPMHEAPAILATCLEEFLGRG